ncbi:hypothetical protein BOW53_13825 [Solemya pervernicosa gill symbiont]|uniref:Glycosyltransferase RgtA/B/C/D-like domain-containing protein n=2 Tax=Gammaproteobacteria incertae sedis TaxID=118884 RepID=A0A1T2L195_9GAMM|nr:hypothetical protein BOW53_13825 [Solemya pervernicosa gill symbiont]
MMILGEWWSVYEFNTDEGLNLQKAALVNSGYQLYSDIWSDQPPVLTYILAAVHELFPFSVTAARTTILLFSAVLFISLFRIVRRFEGRGPALAAVSILASGKLYLTLSVSVMIGLPAIALTVLAIDILTINSPASRWIRTVTAGIVYALALQIKLFVVTAAPALLLAAWFAKRDEKVNGYAKIDSIKNSIIFIITLILSIYTPSLLLHSYHFEQLILPHTAAASTAIYAESGGFTALLTHLWKSSTAALLFGTIGILLTTLHFSRSRAVALLWLTVGFIALTIHRPLWFHHPLLLVIPLSWLGGIALADLLNSGGRLRAYRPPYFENLGRYRFLVTIVILLLSLQLIANIWKNIWKTHKVFNQQSSNYDHHAVARLKLFLDDTQQLVTDRPMDAYRVGRLVPPELAVWSSKRRSTHAITDEDVLKIIARTPATQVSLRRFVHTEDFLSQIEKQLTLTSSVLKSNKGKRAFHFSPVSSKYRTADKIQAELKADDLANKLLSKLPHANTTGVGGLWRITDNKHYDRPSSSKPLPVHSIISRPAGSAQEVGSCLIAAWEQTAEITLLLEAIKIGEALSCTQSVGGGWKISAPCTREDHAQPDDKKTTFDDGTITSALYYALNLHDALISANLPIPEWLPTMIDRGLNFIVNKQSDDGSWPQALHSSGYSTLPTLNDDAMTGTIRLLIRANIRNHNNRYLDAARRAGDYLLKVQGLSTQTAFAQQYDTDGIPTAARTFEPAAYASLETAYAINALIDLYIATSDEHYRSAAERAATWLRQSVIAPEQWARLYEVASNRPLYASRAGESFYSIEQLSDDERSRYRWIGGYEEFPDIKLALDRMELLKQGREAVHTYDEAFENTALLALSPTARAWFDPERAIENPPPDFISSRHYVESCAQMIGQHRQQPMLHSPSSVP